MKRATALVLVVCLLFPTVALAVDADKATYYGGTVATYAGAKEPIEGVLDLANPEALILMPEKKPFNATTLAIPYKQIDDLEYGQKAGRRVGAAIGYTVLLGPLGLLTLFSKKRKHYLTISFKDEKGMDQVAIIELGKDIVRKALPIIKTRSGKDILYQDDDARKSAGA
jgi:hypothetical protein